MEEFKAIMLEAIHKYAFPAFLVGVAIGVMVARGQANNLH